MEKGHWQNMPICYAPPPEMELRVEEGSHAFLTSRSITPPVTAFIYTDTLLPM